MGRAVTLGCPPVCNRTCLDGAAFCRAYRERGGRASIVVITAAGVDAETVARYGADAYIAKPFEMEAVMDTVARYLHDDGGASSGRP